MISNPQVALALLKALRLTVNLYAQAREKGPKGEVIFNPAAKMLNAWKVLRNNLVGVLMAICKGKVPSDNLAKLLFVAKYVNWGYKQTILSRDLERLTDELVKIQKARGHLSGPTSW